MGLYDFAFCSKIDNKDFVQIPIIDRPIEFISPLSFSFSNISDAIKKYPLIGYEKEIPVNDIIRLILPSMDISKSPTFRAPSEHTIASFVEKGFGVALIAKINLKEFQVKSIELPGSKYSVFLTYLRGKKISPLVERFITYCKSFSNIYSA